jgi:hypothetical protein
MRIRQAEDWHLWEKSIGRCRQALRPTVVSVLRRARLASLLVLLLTGTGLLGTPAFGRSRDEIVADARHKAVEAQRRMRDESCMLDAQCAIDAGRMWGEAMWCMQYPETETCGAVEVQHKGAMHNPKPDHCSKGAASKAGDDCVPEVDPCKQCTDQYLECQTQVNIGIDRCQIEAMRFAATTCGDQLLFCDGNPIPQDLPMLPIVCQEKLTPAERILGIPRCTGEIIRECIKKVHDKQRWGWSNA